MPDLTAAQAAVVLTRALSDPGSGESVLAAFADVPSATFTARRPDRLFRRGEPARLTAGQWSFTATDPGGTRLTLSHVVHGVALRTETVGPAVAGPALAEALLGSASEYGPSAVMSTQAILYGIAVVHDLA